MGGPVNGHSWAFRSGALTLIIKGRYFLERRRSLRQLRFSSPSTGFHWLEGPVNLPPTHPPGADRFVGTSAAAAAAAGALGIWPFGHAHVR